MKYLTGFASSETSIKGEYVKATECRERTLVLSSPNHTSKFPEDIKEFFEACLFQTAALRFGRDGHEHTARFETLQPGP